DWIIDLGPEGGDEGGYVVAEGAPEDVARTPDSYTGQILRDALNLDGETSSEPAKGGKLDRKVLEADGKE
ncbi:MAG: hypothetical protein KAU50_00985, partial [Candidatus Marinimicrobia bacterium]|nr:hypothetical protein [Candidatus Neomarinimicrobiota bacterium]